MSLKIDKSLRLPDTEYFHNAGEKTGICIHHTVGGSAKSSFEWWMRDGNTVGTPFIIARDGTIHEVFDPKGWAWQFGLKWSSIDKMKFEKRFIGIEIASEGGLLESGGKLFCFDRISSRTEKSKDEVFDYGSDYRGYRYFDRYEKPQIDSLIELINFLCDKFEIARKVPKNYLSYHGEKLMDFKGIIGHQMVRKDKSDPAPDIDFWKRVIKECELSPVYLDQQEPEDFISVVDIQKLHESNILEMMKLERSAGSLVKGLMWELQADGRGTYIRLVDADKNGFSVKYELVAGNPYLVKVVAQSLGFKSWEGNRLEVYHA